MELQNTPSTIPPATPTVHVDEVKKLSFWFSQIFIIIATILGVFLAANQGFKQAVVFENIQTDKSNYYLRKSLQNELAFNVGFIKEFIAKVNDGHVQPQLKLETFIWDSMKFSNATLETPSALLGESQMFHRKVDEIMNTSHYPISHKVKLLQELADNMEKNVLPAFENNTHEIEVRLQKQDITV